MRRFLTSFLLVLAATAVLAGAVLWTRAAGASETAARYERPEPDVIRSETRRILSDPSFAPRRSLWEWLLEKLSGLRPPRGSGVLFRILLWVLFIWCVLTLAAILAHLIWTLVVMLRGPREGSVRGAGRPHFRIEHTLSYEELCKRMLGLAEEGRFAEAVGVMMIAAVRWLELKAIVHFHQSKTNGDYVGEYPGARPSSGAFSRFVGAFDNMVYGGEACGEEGYVRMNGLFDRIRENVAQEQEV